LKADPVTRGIYIILLTSMGQERDAEEGYQSGADEYMTKPFSPRSLRKKLHELLD
jgi:DNA-binding response OmpR family regulator